MKSLLCGATTYELTPAIRWLEENARKKNFSTFMLDGQEIQILVTGVGLVQATFSLTKMLQAERYDLLVQIGIGGSYRKDDSLGSVVQVVEECFGDLAGEIFALETGLSSDPPMNWRVSNLDRYTLVSNSDAHSPQKLAREATCFDCDLSYDAIFAALKSGLDAGPEPQNHQ